MSKGQSGHASQHIRATAIRNQCQLIMCTQSFCQIEIVTTVFPIYTMMLWCKWCTLICDRKPRWKEIIQRGAQGRQNNSKNILRCWWGVTGVKCIITRQMSIVNLSSSTEVVYQQLKTSSWFYCLHDYWHGSHHPFQRQHCCTSNTNSNSRRRRAVQQIHILSTNVFHSAIQQCCDSHCIFSVLIRNFIDPGQVILWKPLDIMADMQQVN